MNCAQLTKWFESTFLCMQGDDMRAYRTITLHWPENPLLSDLTLETREQQLCDGIKELLYYELKNSPDAPGTVAYWGEKPVFDGATVRLSISIPAHEGWENRRSASWDDAILAVMPEEAQTYQSWPNSARAGDRSRSTPCRIGGFSPMNIAVTTHEVPRGLTTLSRPIPRGSGEHVARLIRWFESTFDCRQGLPRAWTMHPATTAENARIGMLGENESKWSDDGRAFSTEYWNRDRASYHVLCLQIEGGPEQEKRLCDELREMVRDLLPKNNDTNLFPGNGRDRTLYWRLTHKIEFEVQQPYDQRFDLHPTVAAGMLPQMTPLRCKIYTRIAMPDLDLTRCEAHCPEGGLIPKVLTS